MQPQAKISNLQNYIAVYYDEELDPKIKASQCILELFMDFNNLEQLLEHESLLPVLSRTLAENKSKSIELYIYVLSTFYILSNYRQFQEYITQHGVGKTILQVLQNQLQRFDLLYSQYLQMLRRNQEKDRITSKTQVKKLNILIWKQDKLFYICLNILLNITDDPNIQKRMRKFGIVEVLIRCLERNDFHLLIVVLVFLQKLSIISYYKDLMVQNQILQKLVRFFDCGNEILLKLSLLIYYNLAFDKKARECMEKETLIPRFVSLLEQNNQIRMTALKIVYLISTDSHIRYTLAHIGCMKVILKLVLFQQPSVQSIELLALAINLAANERNVEYVSQEQFYKIIDKAIKRQDPILFKLCKNILRSAKALEVVKAQSNEPSNGLLHQLQETMYELIKEKLIKLLMLKSKNEEMSLQILGVMTHSDLGALWKQILINNDKFISFLEGTILNELTEDDIVMQTIMLVSNICQDAQCCQLIERLFEPLLALFLRKDYDPFMGTQYDPELLGQMLYAIYSFIFHGVGLDIILRDETTKMVIQKLISDPNEGVRAINQEVLTILREQREVEFTQKIKMRKFQQHNQKWLNEVQGNQHWEYHDSYAYNDEMLDPRMWESEDDYD